MHKDKEQEMEKNGVRRGTWTKEEDILLKKCIENFGEGRWHLVPLRAGLNRCRKSCRLRWLNYLKPNLKRDYFNIYEIDLIQRLHKLLGNRWTLIAGRLPGRTANDIKNFWNTQFIKKSSSKKQKNMITQSNIIRPRPRTFTKSQLVPSNCPSTKINVEDMNNKKPSSLGPTNEKDGAVATPNIPVPDLATEPTFLPGEDDEWIESWWGNWLAEMKLGKGEAAADPNIVFSNEDNVSTELLTLPGEDSEDQCIMWGNLLEMTEIGEAANSVSFCDEDIVINKPT